MDFILSTAALVAIPFVIVAFIAGMVTAPRLLLDIRVGFIRGTVAGLQREDPGRRHSLVAVGRANDINGPFDHDRESSRSNRFANTGLVHARRPP